MEDSPHLGFPAPLLGMEPQRLPVLHDDGECLVLGKPAGILVQADPWYPRLPLLVEAIRYQAARGKPECVRLGIGTEGLWAVHDLDPEVHGLVLFTRSRARGEDLKNALGSGALRFTFTFLTKGNVAANEVECSLPLARHNRLPRMLVTSTSGKQAHTVFRRGAPVGAYTRWHAETRFPRRHQILLHALESGLPVLGDRLYAREQPPLLSDFKRDYQGKREQDERPLYDGPACFLEELDYGSGTTVHCPPPPRWAGLERQLTRHTHA